MMAAAALDPSEVVAVLAAAPVVGAIVGAVLVLLSTMFDF